MSEIETLLSEIDDFLGVQAIAETTFGRLAVNDGKFVGRLRSGRQCTFATARRVRDFIAAHRTDAAA